MRALLLCPLIGGRWRHHHKVRPAAVRFGVHSAPLAQPVVQDLAFCIRRRHWAIRDPAVGDRVDSERWPPHGTRLEFDELMLNTLDQRQT